ncbi:thiamine phosphate synthase [Roseococcus sp. XZZS9]|uniref:Thiamine phosphate synthase n=1 Tax=Roseococcus pinisoli TaxID=2835040 RepID=A0ABS5QA78_9PROT|nr:thiamine phosphate synthase [Roseococcus pinisoli]MBS7810619.1 thiamine phosphate synthase [Roseococcus pinisoli]
MLHRIRRGARGARVPGLWLLSDPVRLPDPSSRLSGLPRGSAVLLRGAAPEVARRVARLCREKGLVLLVGGDGRAALRLGAGLHVPDRAECRHLLPFLLNRKGKILSGAVHGRVGVARVRRLRAEAALVSPAFPTASHPGAPALGPFRWGALARAAARPAVALGGMTALSARRLPRTRLAGWAAIGAWQGHVSLRPQCLREVALRR